VAGVAASRLPVRHVHLSVGRAKLAERRAPARAPQSTVRPDMAREHTYAVTLIKPGSGIPSVEVGAYTYTGDWLPEVGETIAIRPTGAPEGAAADLQGYVTKVNPVADAPISVVEVEGQGPDDDVVAQPDDHRSEY